MADQPETAAPALPVTYALLMQKSPEYDGEYWHRLDALYHGGKKLLQDEDLMSVVFPRHRDERPHVYAERRRRAFYVPYAGGMIEHILAGLGADPLAVNLKSEDESKTPPLPEFYKDFCDDVSPDGGLRVTLQELAKEEARTAFITKTAWVLVDLPSKVDDTGRPKRYGTALDQEKDGALDAYAVCLNPKSVIRWDQDEAGELRFVVVHTEEVRLTSFRDPGNVVTKVWMVYARDGWEKFERAYPKDTAPQDSDVIPSVASGTYEHRCVPIVRLVMPDGLWAMDKLEGLAREHLNKRASLSWAEYSHAFQELYEFLAAETSTKEKVIGEAQEDPGRALSQRRGQGYVQVRGSEDKAMFVGPSTEGFTHMLASTRDVRDEMHRVMHQMALAVDNSGAALKRSGESKAIDSAAVAVILGALGQLVRKFSEDLVRMVSTVRLETKLVDQWEATGAKTFDAVAVADAIDQALSLEQVRIPSATFQKRFKFQVAKTVLGDNAKPDDLDAIEKELDEGITEEDFEPVDDLAVPPGKPGAKPPAKPAPAKPALGKPAAPKKTPPPKK